MLPLVASCFQKKKKEILCRVTYLKITHIIYVGLVGYDIQHS